MILVYSARLSARLQYICSFIFSELMQLPCAFTDSKELFREQEAVKLNYSGARLLDEELWVTPHTLLFETDIRQQPVNCFMSNGYPAFFGSEDGELDFDIFAASFYLLSRYEEYLPHSTDGYGRFDHRQSLAAREGFLSQPLVNTWAQLLAKKLQEKFPKLHPVFPSFSFVPTYDIDMAYSYLHKGLLRNAGGFLKAPTTERLRVLMGVSKDPFDVYDWLNQLHDRYTVNAIYFFLVAQKNGQYDKNILPGTAAMQQLIARHAAVYTVGVHPSWQSGSDEKLLQEEIGVLEKLCHTNITHSRQHYIRFNLPAGYRRLIDAGITDDYSMGYGSINGFRASVASSFYWYDLEKDVQTSLRVHPFCFMDANSFYEQQLTAAQAYEELMGYYDSCKKVNGTLTTIWHNNFFGTNPEFAGWKECYEKFIQQLRD